jgi:hypothetical protein
MVFLLDFSGVVLKIKQNNSKNIECSKRKSNLTSVNSIFILLFLFLLLLLWGTGGLLQGSCLFLGLGISSQDMDSAHTGRFIRKRKVCS